MDRTTLFEMAHELDALAADAGREWVARGGDELLGRTEGLRAAAQHVWTAACRAR